MGTVYVARSARLGKWGSDVGLSKSLFKIGYTDEPVKPLVAAGWAGETDWVLIRTRDAEGLEEAALIARLARKEKMIDPKLYPKLKGAAGVFKVLASNVENQMLVERALASESELKELKLKPADFADYLIRNALG